MPTINIAFRGLLVLNDVQGRTRYMEIGVLEEKHAHVPRIMTFRNGVREETMLLDLDGNRQVLQLMVDDPATTGITLREDAGQFNRMANPPSDEDFRWILDLENAEFPYVDIEKNFKVNRTKLKRVVKITSGEFYTRLKSSVLRRSENGGTPVDFGAVGGVMGLAIPVNSGGAKLLNPAGDALFTFSSDANVMYEFANSPADTETTPVDHFHHYYDIFQQQPGKKFSFEKKPQGGGIGPGPNPALCGKIFLSKFPDSLE